jgi:hypothetical protein
MTKSITSARKSARGRPRIDAVPVNTRFPPAEIARLDAWIKDQLAPKPTRPEAIRRLVEIALATNIAEPASAERVRKSSKLADRTAQELVDKSFPPEGQQRRKRALIRGPKEFRGVRGDQPKTKRGK